MGDWISESGPYKDKTFDLLGLPQGVEQYHSDNDGELFAIN